MIVERVQFPTFLYTIVIALITLVFSGTTLAQETDTRGIMKLFIDCRCDKAYVRQEINFVSHVRDQGLANVQLFIYDIAKGGGGRIYNLDFKGSGTYAEITSKTEYDTNANMSSDDVRKGLLKAIKSGLLPFVLESEMADNIEYKISNRGLKEKQDIDFDDPWNNWIFEIYGEAELNKESSRKEFEYELGFESDRVTEKWRVRYRCSNESGEK